MHVDFYMKLSVVQHNNVIIKKLNYKLALQLITKSERRALNYAIEEMKKK